MLHGSGIRLAALDASPPIIGFYATHVITAPTEAEAGEKAIQRVRSQWSSGKYAVATNGSLPKVAVESIAQISLWAKLTSRPKGHTFYASEDDAA